MNLYLQYTSMHGSRDLGLTHVGEEIKGREMGHGQKLGSSVLEAQHFIFLNGVEQGGTAITSSSIKEAGYFIQIDKEAGLWCIAGSRRPKF